MSTSRELVRVSQLSDDSQLVIQTNQRSVVLTVNDARRWLGAETAPSYEIMKFLMTCQARRVDPFLGEAHFFEIGGKWTTVVDISGWIEVAEIHPQYDGHECGLVIQQVITPAKPATKTSPAVPAVMGEIRNIDDCIKPEGWHAIGGWCRVHRKDRRVPTYRAVSMLEYNRDNRQWKALPHTMIVKVAVVQAFAASGIVARSGGYIREELPEPQMDAIDVESEEAGDVEEAASPQIQLPSDDGHADAEVATESHTESPTCTSFVPSYSQLSPGIVQELMEAIGRSGMTGYEIDCMLARRGLSEINELDDRDAREIISKLNFKWDQDHAGEILLPDPQPAEATQGDASIDAAQAIQQEHEKREEINGDIVNADGEIVGTTRDAGDTVPADDRAGDREIRDREIDAAHAMWRQANERHDVATATGIVESIIEAYGQEATKGWDTLSSDDPADSFEISDAPRREERVEPAKRKRAKKE